MRKRGSGECGKCGASYSNRDKSADCPACGTHLGGSVTSPTTKKKRKDIPVCVLIYDAGTTCIYFVKSSVGDDRCLVMTEGGARVCSQEKCKQNRAVYLTSGNDGPFTCKHIEQIVHAESSRFSVEMDESMISAHPCDLETKHALRKCLSPGFPTVIKVSERNYAVYANPTATNPLGFCHVKTLEGRGFLCGSKECQKPTGNTKTTKTRQFCTHVNILCCVLREKTLLLVAVLRQLRPLRDQKWWLLRKQCLQNPRRKPAVPAVHRQLPLTHTVLCRIKSLFTF